MPEGWSDLDRALEGSLARLADDRDPPVVLFSGGVDSGLLAWELGRRGRAALFTIGIEPAPDLRAAADGAGAMGMPWTGRRLEDRELESIRREVADELEVVAGPRRGIFLALAAAAATAPPGVLVCGQGVDEMFLGYAHYRTLSPELAARRSEADLRALLASDWPRSARLAGRFGRELRAPYLDPEFVTAAAGIPVGDRLPGVEPKAAFRRWARHRGLPATLADRPKRALQYGSGIDRWLRRGGATELGSPPRPAGLAARRGCR